MLDYAIKLSRKHVYDKNMNFWLCAVIVKGGSIVGVGYNKTGSSMLVEEFKTKNYNLQVHAEIDAVLDARRGEKNIDLTGCKMYVARRLKKDCEHNPLIAISRPCPMCQLVIKEFGIKKVYYTINNKEYGTMKI